MNAPITLSMDLRGRPIPTVGESFTCDLLEMGSRAVIRSIEPRFNVTPWGVVTTHDLQADLVLPSDNVLSQ